MIECTYSVNKKIKQIISEDRLHQGIVADKAGISRAVFSKIVRCKRKVYANEVTPIAMALRVPIETLFSVNEQ